ncbi:hypothetical protein CR513_48523, partial [Mucuna pruriens]
MILVGLFLTFIKILGGVLIANEVVYNRTKKMKLKIRAILRKGNCLGVIEGKHKYITKERWKEMDDNVVANLYLVMTNSVLASVVEKKTVKEI